MYHYFGNTPEDVATQFAKHFYTSAKSKPVLHVALSGGSTPKLLFDILAKNYATKINWSGVHLWWGDERCVSPMDDESNFKMTKERLLDHIAIPAENVHRVLGENDPKEEAVRYGSEIEKWLPLRNGMPKFDLIILGMGEDGHTASIFPHEMHLLKDSSICGVATHPVSGQKRITLTGKTINNADDIVFLVTGASKKEKITTIINKEKGCELYPATFIDPRQGKLGWYMDYAALGN
jgi:6-phosphogluconolactonase